MSRVPRHNNSYGKDTLNREAWTQYRNRTLTGPYGNWIGGTPHPVLSAISVRLMPVTGGRADGFRLPTDWGMLALRSSTRPYDYELRVTNGFTNYRGNGSDASHGVPKPNVGYTSSSTGVVVLPSLNTINRARTEALNKIRDQKIDVGTALAESGQTVKMLALAVSRLLHLYRTMRKGHLYKRTTSNSSLWLEFQYGWKPLMSDIYGMQEQLKEGFRSKDQLFKVERQIKSALDPRDFVSPSGKADEAGFSFLKRDAEEIVKVVYWQKVSNASLLALNQLGLVNPALIAWELVPFSFVIDWLVPIGAFLGGLTATLGTTFVSGYEDRIVRCDLSWEHYRTGTFVSGTKGYTEMQQFAFQRLRKTNWDWPVPYWKNPFTSTHVANAIALLNATSKRS